MPQRDRELATLAFLRLYRYQTDITFRGALPIGASPNQAAGDGLGYDIAVAHRSYGDHGPPEAAAQARQKRATVAGFREGKPQTPKKD